MISPIGHDPEEDLPELGARLVVLRRHVRHQVHDQPPDHVVVHDPEKDWECVIDLRLKRFWVA